MRILRLRLKNFLAYEDVDLDLARAAPVVAVVARHAGQPGRSNRGGKSALVFDAPMFALSGWCRTGNARDVVRWGTGEATVRVDVEVAGGVLSVKRTARLTNGGLSASTKVEVAGAEGASNVDAQDRIDAALSLPATDLPRVCMFRQGDVMGFLGGDQQRVLAAWLDQGRWTAAEKAAAVAVRDAGRVSRDAERLLEEAEEEAALLREREAAVASAREVQESADALLQEAERTVDVEQEERDVAAAVAAARAASTSLIDALAASRSAAEMADAAYESAADAAEARLDSEHDAAVARRDAALSVARTALSTAESDVTSTEAVARQAVALVKAADRIHSAHARAVHVALGDEADARRAAEAAVASSGPCHVTDGDPCGALLEMRETDADRARSVETARADAILATVPGLREDRERSAEEATAARKALVAADQEARDARASRDERTAALASVKVRCEADLEEERAVADAAYEASEEAADSLRNAAREAAAASCDPHKARKAEAEARLSEARAALADARGEAGAVDVAAVRNAASRARRRLSAAEVGLEASRQAEASLDRLDAAAALAARRSRAARIARIAFSPRGIPARVVEAHLAQLAADSNEFLESLGVEPRVRWRTSRELTRWRRDCVACGGEESSGRGANRVCSECATPWARDRKDEFACVLSHGGREVPIDSDSGGGKTLVALAARFSAARMLAASRGVSMDMLVLDEPFAALDSVNLDHALGLVAGTLGRYGISQTFLVSHVPGVRDVAGDVVTVVREGRVSRVEATW